PHLGAEAGRHRGLRLDRHVEGGALHGRPRRRLRNRRQRRRDRALLAQDPGRNPGRRAQGRSRDEGREDQEHPDGRQVASPRMPRLNEEQLDLFRAKNYAVVATVGEDGSPQTTIVWVDEEDGRPVFNTTNRRAKGRNLRRDPRLSILVWDNDNPYRYVEV